MVQGRKESHEVCYSPNLAATDWPLKQLLLLHGGSLVDPRLSRYSFFHCPSTTLPELPIPIPPKRDQPSSGDSSNSYSEENIGDTDYGFTDAVEERRPYFPNQKDINDLIRDLGLTKSNAELLTSSLKQWNLLDESVQVTDQIKRHQTFSSFFSRQDGLYFCNNVAGLFEAIGISCNPREWRLYSSTVHSGASKPCCFTTETTTCLSLWLTLCISNRTKPVSRCCWVPWSMSSMDGRSLESSKWCHSWWVFEAVLRNVLVSFVSGTAVTLAHYHRKDWPQLTKFSVEKSNVKWVPLIEPQKMLIPPLHIKLDLIKQFLTALDKEPAAFKYLQVLFPKLSVVKVKAGIFVGPQIKKIVECDEFAKLLSSKQKTAWNSFVAVVHGFLGNHKAENYLQLVQTLIKNYAKMGYRRSLKVHTLDAHPDKFKKNMGAYSEE